MDSADADGPSGRNTRSSDNMLPAPHGGRTRRTRTTSNEQHSDNISDDTASDGAVGPHPRTRSQLALEEPQPYSERSLRSRENHGVTSRFASSAQTSEHVSDDGPHGRARSPDSESRSRPRRGTARRSLQSENSHHSDEDISNQSSKAPVRRSSRRARSSPDAFDEASSEEDMHAALSQIRSSRRRSGQRAKAVTEADISPGANENESGQERADKPGRKLASRRPSGRRRVSSNGYPYSDANESDHSDERAETRQINTRKRTSQKAIESDQEDHSEQSEDEFEEEQNTQSSDDDSMEIVPSTTGRFSKRSRKSTRAAIQRQAYPSANSRRATRGRTPSSYLDPSSSEFGSDVDNGDISESSTEKHPKRKRQATSQSPRRLAKAKKKKISEAEHEAVPVPKRWPEIGIKDITRVTHAILERLACIDEMKVFAVPVVESNPHLSEGYRQVISKPMDFRTIREEQLCLYDSIQMLQDDLILVFNNCIHYNGAENEFGRLAKTMLEMLEDVFRQVCSELDIVLPRRW